jgi:hypothetical protein
MYSIYFLTFYLPLIKRCMRSPFFLIQTVVKERLSFDSHNNISSNSYTWIHQDVLLVMLLILGNTNELAATPATFGAAIEVPVNIYKCVWCCSINFTPGAKNINIHFPNVRETSYTLSIFKVQSTNSDHIVCKFCFFIIRIVR